MSKPVVRAKNVGKTFGDGNTSLEVLRDVSLEVQAGEMVAIVGASGSGKSTLLHILGALDLPDSGSIEIDSKDPASLSDAERGVLRNQSLGFVYQFHHLLGEFTAQENVAMPLFIRRTPKSEAMAQAMAILTQVGLAERATHLPGQLSGGERQRVALARALVTKPKCMLADEPTGNLDRESAKRVFELLTSLSKELGTAFIIVTHDLRLARKADRVFAMEAGRLVPALAHHLSD